MELRQVKSEIVKTVRFFPVLLGASVGFLYYNFIGCVTGTCAITSNPWSSMAFGALIGAAFIKKKRNAGSKNQIERSKE